MLPDAATTSNFAASDTQCLSPPPARCNVGRCLPEAMGRVLCSDCGREPPFAGSGAGVCWRRAPPKPRQLLILPPQTRSVFRRLRPGLGLGAVSPMLWVARYGETRARSAVLRLRLGVGLGAVSPKLSAPCGAEVPPAKRESNYALTALRQSGTPGNRTPRSSAAATGAWRP